jgi:cyclopropane-fatty-acyl-phospholipid synthase
MTSPENDHLLIRKALERLTGHAPLDFVIGEEKPASSGQVRKPVIRFADRSAALAVLLAPELAFGDLYSEGKIEVQGSLVDVLERLYTQKHILRNWRSRLISKWLSLVQANTRRGSRRNIHRHYDLSNDFYRSWLDQEMVYTCAYFRNPNVSLEEAQRAKMDLVCRKLWLRPGERVVEAGCGWGSLALHMARNYGARVTAFNISHEQIAYARERAKQEGLSGLVDFVEDDYRNISGGYDAFVSVGMLEHVGRDHYREIGKVIHRAIGDAGRGFLHFIGRNQPRPLSVWIRKRIFPGAYPPTLTEVLPILSRFDYSVLDVENLRLHYALTLEHWLSRYEQHMEEVVQRFGKSFARGWRLYLAGSITGFRLGTLQLFQLLFAGRKCSAIPLTREHLYTSKDSPQFESDLWTPVTF